MGVLHGERLQFRVPPQESEVVTAQLADLRPYPPDLRLKPPDLVGEGVDGALLLVTFGRAAEGVALKDFFKELDESARPAQVSLIDPPRYRVGQSQGHRLLPSKKKRRGVKRGSDILLTNDASISPKSPLFASHYLIAE